MLKDRKKGVKYFPYSYYFRALNLKSSMINRTISAILFLIICITGSSKEPDFTRFLNDPWVNSQMEKMTIRDKIGQLVMIEVYPDQSELHRGNIEKLIRQYKPGGILIMKGAPSRSARWISGFQEVSEIPLIVSIDAESGPAFRFDSIISFPTAQALGAIRQDSALYAMGRAVGRQLKSAGINMNFAPVADINTRPGNPIINYRSFGEKRENVAGKAVAYAMGMQDEGVAAVAKHFPGHGDTREDSHHKLPVLQHSQSRMDSVELYPFRKLSEAGITGIMTGHIGVPSIDPSGRAASVSALLTNGLLREKTGYRGLVITDAMNMKGVALAPGQSEVQALKAGNDMVEFVVNLPKTIAAIENAVKDGTLKSQDIDLKCRRVLALKRWLNLHEQKTINKGDVVSQMNSIENELVVRQLTESTLTAIKNENLLPLMRLDTLRIATVNIGASGKSFQDMVSRYSEADHFSLSVDASTSDIETLLQKLNSYNLVIAGVGGLRSFPGGNFGVTGSQVKAVEIMAAKTRLITLFFGNAYALRFFSGIEKSSALVVTYQDNTFAQELAVQALFGAIDITGRLPVTPDNRFPANSGVDIKKNGRLKFTIPEEVGISSEILAWKIDSIAAEGLREKAFPGAQVVIAKDGKVIFEKCYGYLTFDNDEPVTTEVVYDWASVTKVTGPLPALMKLAGEGKFDINQRISHYLPYLKGSDKEHIKIRDILTHQARLRPIIPLWQSKFARDPVLREQVFRTHPYTENDLRISANLYMGPEQTKAFFDEIRESSLLTRKSYTYTCVGFHLWPTVISSIVGKPYEDYMKETFYKRLGANTITYNAYLHFPQSRIAPTEVDDYFRMETLRGFVHDEGAAILGGISGNAGLFGSASDLAKLFQMYLWKGYYGGEQFIPAATVEEFIKVQFPKENNRRALGFDKPELNHHLKKSDDVYPAPGVSASSFGHSGYTGTFVWADPESQILFILFTNRVYPTRNNNLLGSMNIRGSMLQSIYDSMN
jgi:beta-N-acetylhexosaminidase